MYICPVIIFAVFLLIPLSNAQIEKCPDGETFNNCGSRCPLTCEFPTPRPCTDECVKGCFCNGDAVRNSSGICVPQKQCCPQGKIFKQCGTACPPTCKTPKPEICNLMCVEGCFCPEEEVQDENGKCVPLKECCPAGEVYKQCDSDCGASCKNPHPVICPALCWSGCFCPKGKLRNNFGECVIPEKCCPPGEIYLKCGTACPPTCENPSPKICSLHCISGCFCANGTVRNTFTGQCILPTQCGNCPPGEIFITQTICEPICPNSDEGNCRLIRNKGCTCTKGLIRDVRTGKCVRPLDCSKCENNEETY